MRRRPLSHHRERAAEWRRRAQRLHSLAQETLLPRLRVEILDQARQWDALARAAEAEAHETRS
jgi:hypothetical protein